MSDGSSLRPAMKLLFVILAHDRPADAAELARTLVAATSDGRALIHFDARASAAAFEALGAAVADEPRIGLVKKRVACRWGGFGLVEAPLNALAQAEADGAGYRMGPRLRDPPLRRLPALPSGGEPQAFISPRTPGASSSNPRTRAG